MLDLNGDGVQTLAQSAGVKFDLLADGTPVQSGWVSPQDGLLALDRNHDGRINDGSELFGSSTRLADGSRAADGYQALRQLDSNGDGVISSADAAFADLRVWVDANANALSESGELRSLASLHIADIQLSTQQVAVANQGNIIGLSSSFTTTDGQSHLAADVWLAYGQAVPTVPSATQLEARVNLMAQEIHAFQEVGAVPPAALPGMGTTAAHPNGGMLNPAILADAIGQFKSASTLLAPGEIPAPRVGQSSAVTQLASDPTRDKSPGMQIMLAPSRPP
jgi:hypothetical protein